MSCGIVNCPSLAHRMIEAAATIDEFNRVYGFNACAAWNGDTLRNEAKVVEGYELNAWLSTAVQP